VFPNISHISHKFS